MPKTLSDTSSRVKESHRRVQEAIRKQNVPYAIDLLMSILEMEPELDAQRKELRELQLGQLKKKKKANPLSSVTGMGKVMAVKGAIKKSPEKALPLAEELLKVDPLNTSFMETYEEAAKASGYPRAAAILYSQVLKIDRSNADLLEKLGRLYLEMNESHNAKETFEKLGELKPNDQQVIKWIKDTSAMDSMTKGGWEQEGDFRNKLKDESQSAELEQAGRAQQSMSDMERLVATQRKRLEAEPDNLNLYRPLADTLVKSGHLQEGLDVLYQADEKANHADPMIQRAISETTVKIYNYNIKVLKEEGDPEGAKAQEEEKNRFMLEDIADKVKRYPNDLAFKFDYGELLFEQGKLDEAISQFQQAQRNPKRRVDALYLMGRCFKSKGQYDIAASQLQKAAEEVPSMDDQKMGILYELGEVLEAQGDLDTALSHFKQIYAVDIGYKDVAKKIEAGYARKKRKKTRNVLLAAVLAVQAAACTRNPPSPSLAEAEVRIAHLTDLGWMDRNGTGQPIDFMPDERYQALIDDLSLSPTPFLILRGLGSEAALSKLNRDLSTQIKSGYTATYIAGNDPYTGIGFLTRPPPAEQQTLEYQSYEIEGRVHRPLAGGIRTRLRGGTPIWLWNATLPEPTEEYEKRRNEARLLVQTLRPLLERGSSLLLSLHSREEPDSPMLRGFTDLGLVQLYAGDSRGDHWTHRDPEGRVYRLDQLIFVTPDLADSLEIQPRIHDPSGLRTAGEYRHQFVWIP